MVAEGRHWRTRWTASRGRYLRSELFTRPPRGHAGVERRPLPVCLDPAARRSVSVTRDALLRAQALGPPAQRRADTLGPPKLPSCSGRRCPSHRPHAVTGAPLTAVAPVDEGGRRGTARDIRVYPAQADRRTLAVLGCVAWVGQKARDPLPTLTRGPSVSAVVKVSPVIPTRRSLQNSGIARMSGSFRPNSMSEALPRTSSTQSIQRAVTEKNSGSPLTRSRVIFRTPSPSCSTETILPCGILTFFRSPAK